MNFTRTNIATTNRDKNGQNNSEREADVIWLSEYAKRFSAKEGAALCDMTPSGFKKLQAGEHAIRFEKLSYWMRRDPLLAAMYAERVGLILPGQAEFAGALTQAFNAYQRTRGGE